MPYYLFTAIDPTSNRITEGKIEALNVREVKDKLRQEGQVPTRIEVDTDAMASTSLLQNLPLVGELFAPKVPLKEISIMTQQMSTLIDAGMPLIEGLYILEQQSTNKRLQSILKTVRLDVIAGDSFSSAISKYPGEFSPLYINMMKSAEVTGEMDKICGRLSGLLDKLIALQQKLKSASTYPMITIVIVALVVAGILLFIIPQFQSMFEQFGAKLPMPTQILIAMSQFLQSYWWLMMIAGFSAYSWFESFRKGSGKMLIDEQLLRIPVLGNLCTTIYVSRFVRTLSTMIASGVSLTAGIDCAAGTVDNLILRRVFEKAKENLINGGRLSIPLEKSGMCPAMVTKMIAVGEETGKLETMLNKSADYLDSEAEATLTLLTTLMEPLMMVVVGVVVLGLLIALYLPIFELSNVIQGNH